MSRQANSILLVISWLLLLVALFLPNGTVLNLIMCGAAMMGFATSLVFNILIRKQKDETDE